MTEKEYCNLIYNGKLNDLAETWNISDLTRYKYRGKYLLEFLLEKKIHNTRMDNQASKNQKWFLLYLKYNIINPLINSQLDILLLELDNELILEKLLKKLSTNKKIKLYRNIKKNNYWLYRLHEKTIIDLFDKYDIEIQPLFIELPLVMNNNMHANSKLERLLNDLSNAYQNNEQIALKSCISELKKYAKYDRIGTYNDIKKLLKIKKNWPNFKLSHSEYLDDDENKNGGYFNEYYRRIAIDRNSDGVFAHELSHLLFSQFDKKNEYKKKYNDIIRYKLNKHTIKKIVSYIRDFHVRYREIYQYFSELYAANVKKEYGSMVNYMIEIGLDIIENKVDYINFDQECEAVAINLENLDDAISEIIRADITEYVNILAQNYYEEELSLENLLDALLKGNIYEKKYEVESYSGHKKKYFYDCKENSFDECLADFYAIKKSCHSERIINKLREIVGDDLVNLLEDYIKINRLNQKTISIPKKDTITSYIDVCDDMDQKKLTR